MHRYADLARRSGGSDQGDGSARGDSGRASSDDEAPLFGQGVSPGDGENDGGASGGKGSDSGGVSERRSGATPGSADTRGARADAGDPPGQSLSRTAAAAESGSGGTLLTVAIVLAVLLLGGVAALVLRSGPKRFGS